MNVLSLLLYFPNMSDFINTLLKEKKLRIQGPLLQNEYCDRWFKDTQSQPVHKKVINKGRSVRCNDRRLNAVIWDSGHITEYRLSLNTDTVSFNFTGCVMAFYQVSDQEKYVVHIHTGADDCKYDWVNYMIGKPHLKKLVMFRPNCTRRELLIDDLRQRHDAFWDVEVMGVITTDLACYSVGLVLRDMNDLNLWDVEFIEQHTVSSNPDMYTQSILGGNPSINQGSIKPIWDSFWQRQSIREVSLPWRPWKMNLFGIDKI